MTAEHGQTAVAINYAFASREALMQEFEKMQEYPVWADSEFQEVSFDELEQKSIELADQNKIKEEKSEVYVKPSVVATMGVKERKPVDMMGRGIDSLTKISDRDVVEKPPKPRTEISSRNCITAARCLEAKKKKSVH